MKSIRENLRKALAAKGSKHIFKIVMTVILLWANIAGAQELSVKGTIVTSNGVPLSGASVSLLNAVNGALVQTALSDSKGLYNFTVLADGEYRISIEAIGFKIKNGTSFRYALLPINLDPITVEESAEVLQEVIIRSDKPAVERKQDRMVVNVAGSTLAAGNNAADILERAPGVSLDREGNISLNGKTGVTVMINDKLTYLSNTQLASLLRSTDGNTIQSIEIISNPSSKYDAAGNSGIINIKLKKNKSDGVNGSAVLGMAKAHYLSNNASVSVNVKDGNLNTFAALSRINDKKDIRLSSERIITSQQSTTDYLQNSRIRDFSVNNSYRAGADYQTGKSNTAGIVVSGNFNENGIVNKGTAGIGERPGNSTSRQVSRSDDSRTMKNIGINLSDRFTLDTLGQSITVDLDYLKYKNSGDALLRTNTPDDQPGGPSYLRQSTPSEIVVNALKADYVYPGFKGVKLEGGIKISEVKTDNTIAALRSPDNAAYTIDETLSNNFRYNEKIQAGYLNLSKTIKNTTLQIGLRAEYTDAKGVLVNSAEPPVSQRYLDFFPNVFVLQSLSNTRNISFNLNRRIERPNYQSLNPFSYFIDPYTRQLGNPFLRPQYANTIALNYTDNLFNIGASYSRTTDVRTETVVTDPETKISSVTFIN